MNYNSCTLFINSFDQQLGPERNKDTGPRIYLDIYNCYKEGTYASILLQEFKNGYKNIFESHIAFEDDNFYMNLGSILGVLLNKYGSDFLKIVGHGGGDGLIGYRDHCHTSNNQYELSISYLVKNLCLSYNLKHLILLSCFSGSLVNLLDISNIHVFGIETITVSPYSIIPNYDNNYLAKSIAKSESLEITKFIEIFQESIDRFTDQKSLPNNEILTFNTKYLNYIHEKFIQFVYSTKNIIKNKSLNTNRDGFLNFHELEELFENDRYFNELLSTINQAIIYKTYSNTNISIPIKTLDSHQLINRESVELIEYLKKELFRNFCKFLIN